MTALGPALTALRVRRRSDVARLTSESLALAKALSGGCGGSVDACCAAGFASCGGDASMAWSALSQPLARAVALAVQR